VKHRSFRKARRLHRLRHLLASAYSSTLGAVAKHVSAIRLAENSATRPPQAPPTAGKTPFPAATKLVAQRCGMRSSTPRGARYGAGTVRTGHPRPEARDEVPFNAPRDLPLAGELGPERLGVERQVGPNVAEGDGNYRKSARRPWQATETRAFFGGAKWSQGESNPRLRRERPPS
jgi:hypothetical protein